MNYSENDYTEISPEEKDLMSDADGFFGERPRIGKDLLGDSYKEMEYMGSEVEDSSEPGWKTVTDYFIDKDGRRWWRWRQLFIDPFGELVFASSSRKNFGREIKEWDRTR